MKYKYENIDPNDRYISLNRKNVKGKRKQNRISLGKDEERRILGNTKNFLNIENGPDMNLS